MIQNQMNQQLRQNHPMPEGKGRLSIQYAQRQGAKLSYHLLSNEKVENRVLVEIPGDQGNKVGLCDLQLLTFEQRRIEADRHEHPYECENSPWRRQQTAGTGQGNSTYTNRY